MSNMRYFIDIASESTVMPRPIGFEQNKNAMPSPTKTSDEEALRYNPKVAAEIEKIFSTGRQVNITNMTKDEFMARYNKTQ